MVSYYNFQCLNKKQKNQLSTWTIRAVVANDLLTDDSFVVRLSSFIRIFFKHVLNESMFTVIEFN